MLQSIRDRAQGWFAGIIFALICIPFAMWGINHYFDGAENVVVAEVNGEKLGAREVQRNYEQYRQRIQSMFGSSFDMRKFNEETFRRQALNQMVDTLLMRQASLRAGMRMSDKQVAATINSQEAFQRDGKFANDLYERQLQNTGMSPMGFEDQLRRDLLNQQLRQAVADSAFVTSAEIDRITRIRGQRRSLAYLTLAAEPLKSSITLSDEEIQRHYDDHKDRYMTPALVKIAYVDLSLDELAKQVSVDEATLRGYYETHQSNYGTEEQRSANHILVQVAKGASEQDAEAARKKAEDFAKLARQGESFEKIAKEHSDDPGSKTEGGQLGFFSRGVMDPAFDKTVFSMKAGEISDTVRSEFGFHVIRLNEIKPSVTKSFEEARGEIDTAYRREQAERLYFDQSEKLANLAFENPDSLDKVSETLGLPVKASAYFPRTGGDTDVTKDSKAIEAAFSPEVLERGTNSEALELGENRVVVLRATDHKPQELRKLQEVRKEIVETVTSEKAKAAASERGQQLLERLKKGEDRMAVAEHEKLKWQEASDVDRREPKVNRAIVRAAFKLGRPSPGSVLYGGVPLGTGDFAVVAVLDVKDADPAAIDEKEKKEAREQLTRANEDWRDFLNELRSRANIQIHSDKL